MFSLVIKLQKHTCKVAGKEAVYTASRGGLHGEQGRQAGAAERTVAGEIDSHSLSNRLTLTLSLSNRLTISLSLKPSLSKLGIGTQSSQFSQKLSPSFSFDLVKAFVLIR